MGNRTLASLISPSNLEHLRFRSPVTMDETMIKFKQTTPLLLLIYEVKCFYTKYCDYLCMSCSLNLKSFYPWFIIWLMYLEAYNCVLSSCIQEVLSIWSWHIYTDIFSFVKYIRGYWCHSWKWSIGTMRKVWKIILTWIRQDRNRFFLVEEKFRPLACL